MSEPTTPTGKALRELLPGLDGLLALDAATFGPVIAVRPDVWDIIRAFLVSGIPQVESEAAAAGARQALSEHVCTDLYAAMLFVRAEHDGAKAERERLRAEFHAYWEWLVQQPAYGNSGGWGEAAMLKVSTMLAEPEDA